MTMMTMRVDTTKRKKNGYVLIDTMVMVMIVVTAFSAVTWGISTAAQTIARSRERILRTIEEHNEFEKKIRIEAVE
jgi:cytochrome c biogenesis protein CcdA